MSPILESFDVRVAVSCDYFGMIRLFWGDEASSNPIQWPRGGESRPIQLNLANRLSVASTPQFSASFAENVLAILRVGERLLRELRGPHAAIDARRAAILRHNSQLPAIRVSGSSGI